jgi:hypothetical protein
MTTPDGAAPDGAPPTVGEEPLSRWLESRERSASQREAEREATLASDADRDQVCGILSTAFSDGRLTSDELDQRTSRALAARTHGELDDVLAGLARPGGATAWASRPDRGILPRLMFWVVGVITAPFVLIGALLLFFGDDMSSRVIGIVFLVLFLPGPVALYRWAHPRS